MKIPSSFLIFYFIISVFFLFPSLYIVFTNDISNLYRYTNSTQYINAVYDFINSIFLSFIVFFIAYLFLKNKILLFSNKKVNIFGTFELVFLRKYIILRKYLLPLSAFMVSYFFYKVGFSKLALLGSDIDAWEFRMIGFDDTPHIIVAFNELSRRMLLPFLLIVELTQLTINKNYTKYYFYIVLIFFIIGIISTLDRAPLMILIIIFIYKYIFIYPSKKKLFFGIFISIFAISVMASIMTYYQYNIVDFDLSTIIGSAKDFIAHRVLLVPTYAALELSYVRFPIEEPFLNFKFTRLGALFGLDYIGTENDNSVYVTPVGYLADSWRNFGYIAIIFTSFVLGSFAAFIDNRYKYSSFYLSIAISFLFFSFILFLVFGVFYSQGGIMQIIFIVFLFFYFNKNFYFFKF